MDVGSIVWYRKPAEGGPAAGGAPRRRGTTVGMAVGVGTHEDLWRPWAKGKITATKPGAMPHTTVYTVDLMHEVRIERVRANGGRCVWLERGDANPCRTRFSCRRQHDTDGGLLLVSSCGKDHTTASSGAPATL